MFKNNLSSWYLSIYIYIYNMIVCMYECMYGLIDGRMDVCMCMYVTAMHISQESRKHKQHQCILSNHRNIPWILQQVFHWGPFFRNRHFVPNVFYSLPDNFSQTFLVRRHDVCRRGLLEWCFSRLSRLPGSPETPRYFFFGFQKDTSNWVVVWNVCLYHNYGKSQCLIG